jgi:recombinational DNA repair ATPase RecF
MHVSSNAGEDQRPRYDYGGRGPSTEVSLEGGLVLIKGSAGVGKTTIVEAIRRDAKAAARSIRGDTIAQAAAIRLEVEAGFGAVNTTFALHADNPHRELIPRNGGTLF